MKEIGKVTEYNGYYGKIVNQEGKEYLLLNKEIMENEKINELDNVSYVPEEYNNEEVDENIARFVKKLK